MGRNGGFGGWFSRAESAEDAEVLGMEFLGVGEDFG